MPKAIPSARTLAYGLAALVLVLAVLALSTGASVTVSDRAHVRALTAAYNASGHDLFTTFAHAPGNIVFSPYSIGTAMAMVMSGARGDTAAEMATVLRHGLAHNSVDAANASALAILNRYGHASAQLRVANALMVLQSGGDIILPTYSAQLQDKYGAHIFRDSGLAEINGWVKKQTNGKIEKIVDRIETNERAAILNAIYFKAEWQSPFTVKSTADADFHLTPSVKVKVPTMRREGDYAVVTRPGYRAIRLPYSVETLSMVIILPDNLDGGCRLVGELDASSLAVLFEALTEPKKIMLALPRFTASFETDLRPLFMQAGMKRAFSDLADFSGMTKASLALGRVMHRAIIEVNEEGTVAAAATGAFMIASGPPPFVIDRPFLFYITDRATGAILFQGRITDPRAPLS